MMDVYRGLAIVVTALLAGCGRAPSRTGAVPTQPHEHQYDPTPSRDVLLGTWTGPKGRLEVRDKDITITSYSCGGRPNAPQFSETDVCPAYTWAQDWSLAGNDLSIVRTAPGSRIEHTFRVYLGEDGSLHISPAMWFGTMSGASGSVDMAHVGTLEITANKCMMSDMGTTYDAHCRWVERDGKTWLEFEHIFMNKPEKIELVYLREAGLLVMPELLDSRFQKVDTKR